MVSHNQEAITLSIIVPVFNRPAEVYELLESLSRQQNKNFEVVIVEDGSAVKCDQEVVKFETLLNIRYFYKENSGPGLSRNYGFERASGNYAIFLDSDCTLSEHYIQTIHDVLSTNFVDAFGGPDRAHESFTTLQKSINYAMTSFLTTGGIRGGGEKLGKFHPRSFNMGYSRKVFEKTKGFSNMRFGEDIDMSIRILNNGFKTALIKQAYVYHKRRTSFSQFFKQVFNSGIARINLYKRHKGSLKIVHTFPTVFLLGIMVLTILSVLISSYFILPLVLYTILLFLDSSIANKNILTGLMSTCASYVQLTGYGSGFLVAFWKRVLLSKKEYSAFTDNFYD